MSKDAADFTRSEREAAKAAAAEAARGEKIARACAEFRANDEGNYRRGPKRKVRIASSAGFAALLPAIAAMAGMNVARKRKARKA